MFMLAAAAVSRMIDENVSAAGSECVMCKCHRCTADKYVCFPLAFGGSSGGKENSFYRVSCDGIRNNLNSFGGGRERTSN